MLHAKIVQSSLTRKYMEINNPRLKCCDSSINNSGNCNACKQPTKTIFRDRKFSIEINEQQFHFLLNLIRDEVCYASEEKQKMLWSIATILEELKK